MRDGVCGTSLVREVDEPHGKIDVQEAEVGDGLGDPVLALRVAQVGVRADKTDLVDSNGETVTLVVDGAQIAPLHQTQGTAREEGSHGNQHPGDEISGNLIHNHRLQAFGNTGIQDSQAITDSFVLFRSVELVSGGLLLRLHAKLRKGVGNILPVNGERLKIVVHKFIHSLRNQVSELDRTLRPKNRDMMECIVAVSTDGESNHLLNTFTNVRGRGELTIPVAREEGGNFLQLLLSPSTNHTIAEPRFRRLVSDDLTLTILRHVVDAKHILGVVQLRLTPDVFNIRVGNLIGIDFELGNVQRSASEDLIEGVSNLRTIGHTVFGGVRDLFPNGSRIVSLGTSGNRVQGEGEVLVVREIHNLGLVGKGTPGKDPAENQVLVPRWEEHSLQGLGDETQDLGIRVAGEVGNSKILQGNVKKNRQCTTMDVELQLVFRRDWEQVSSRGFDGTASVEVPSRTATGNDLGNLQNSSVRSQEDLISLGIIEHGDRGSFNGTLDTDANQRIGKNDSQIFLGLDGVHPGCSRAKNLLGLQIDHHTLLLETVQGRVHVVSGGHLDIPILGVVDQHQTRDLRLEALLFQQMLSNALALFLTLRKDIVFGIRQAGEFHGFVFGGPLGTDHLELKTLEGVNQGGEHSVAQENVVDDGVDGSVVGRHVQGKLKGCDVSRNLPTEIPAGQETVFDTFFSIIVR